MPTGPVKIGTQVTLHSLHFQALIDTLAKQGYKVIGPTITDGAIVYEPITSVSQLPAGWTDEQKAGSYRLVKRNDASLFGFVVGPQSWKRYLFPSVLRLWSARRDGKGFHTDPPSPDVPKMAFLGVRACELSAIARHDKVFLSGDYRDPAYLARRERVFIVATNCTQAGGTCFCKSTETGPRATSGFDLALTEVLDKDRHYFIVQVGSARGAEILKELPCKSPQPEELKLAETAVSRAAQQMGRSLDTKDLKAVLYRSHEHPRWDETAQRCLNCANCTMVCPTCFCTTVEDVTDLSGNHAERWRKWDSCFTTDFSYIHGGSIRASTKSRYRQWLTHKLASWIDQFGSLGCVGCGRCITWCPVAIDLTEEIQAIRQGDASETVIPPHKEKIHGNS
jgi:ferredoxin